MVIGFSIKEYNNCGAFHLACNKRFQKCGELIRTKIISELDRKSTRLNSSHQIISYAVFCLKKKKKKKNKTKKKKKKQVDTHTKANRTLYA